MLDYAGKIVWSGIMGMETLTVVQDPLVEWMGQIPIVVYEHNNKQLCCNI